MSILERASKIDYKAARREADAIVSATVLGFAATRALLGQPFSFDVEDAEDSDRARAEFPLELARWNAQLDAAAWVLEGLHELVAHNPNADNLRAEDIVAAVGDATAPTRDEVSNRDRDPTITGRTGGDGWIPGARWRRPWMNVVEGPKPEYSGKGAYTGVCDDPLRVDRWPDPALRGLRTEPKALIDVVNNLLLAQQVDELLLIEPVDRLPRMPTRPTVIEKPKEDVPTDRYIPGDATQWREILKGGEALPYGAIAPSTMQSPPGGLGLDPDPLKREGMYKADQVVGYVHGMSQAMVEGAKRGPWCLAHEHAIGKETLKLASCFPCTTFMYAAGFPPSSTHLGRGESWVPPPETSAAGDAFVIKSINYRWHLQCFYYLLLGSRLLQGFFRRDGLRHPNNPYPAIVDRVLSTLKARFAKKDEQSPTTSYVHESICQAGGNLFLDALVFHDKESARLARVLGLANLTAEDVARYQRALARREEPDYAAGVRRTLQDVRRYLPDWVV